MFPRSARPIRLASQDPEEATSLAERLAQDPNWNKATALSLMLFVLLYSPCFVALVVIRQEAGSWGWGCVQHDIQHRVCVRRGGGSL